MRHVPLCKVPDSVGSECIDCDEAEAEDDVVRRTPFIYPEPGTRKPVVNIRRSRSCLHWKRARRVFCDEHTEVAES